MPAEWEIYLLSNENYLTFNPLLPEVVGASILPSNVVAPLRLIANRSDVRLMTRVVAVDADGVTLQDGTRIAGGTVIYTIGSTPQALAAAIDLPKKRGRFVANANLSGDDRVWAIGDCALVPNRHDGSYCPPTAQFAKCQAKVLADNLCATTNGKATREFRYRPKGQLASIGHTKAIAWIYGIRLSGFVAWLLWRGLYLMKIPTLARKARLYLEWSWAMFFPPDISHLSFARTTERDAFAQNTATAPDENGGEESVTMPRLGPRTMRISLCENNNSCIE